MTASIVAATFIATEGDSLEAVIEVGDQRLHVTNKDKDKFGGAQMGAALLLVEDAFIRGTQYGQ